MDLGFIDEDTFETLRVQATKRLTNARLELMAAKAVLSQIETEIVRNHLREHCNVRIGHGVCMFEFPKKDPIEGVVEEIHPVDYYCHIDIVFRPITKKGKPAKRTLYFPFDSLIWFKKKIPSNKPGIGG